MYEFIYETISASRYVGIALLMALFPAETIMPFVGYKASQGSLSLPLAVLVGVAASTAASTLIYMVARQISQARIAMLVGKYGKWAGLSDVRVERAGRMFDKNERSAVFFGRFIPGVRTAVSVPAGYRHMNLAVFLLFTTLGSGISSTFLGLLGYYARTSLTQTQTVATTITYAVGGTLIVLSLLFLWHRWHRLNP